jgi:hypothetical protein
MSHYYNREISNRKPSNIMYSNPKVPDLISQYRNCDSCDLNRAKIPETTCNDCWVSRLVCIRLGCDNKVKSIDTYCEICSKGLLYHPKCEKEGCEMRLWPDNRYCYEHRQ